jgi:hypothetical protein
MVPVVEDNSIHLPSSIVVASIPLLFEALSYFVGLVHDLWILDRAAFKYMLLDIVVIADPSTLEDLLVADFFAVYEYTMTELLNRFLPTRSPKVWRRPLSP